MLLSLIVFLPLAGAAAGAARRRAGRSARARTAGAQPRAADLAGDVRRHPLSLVALRPGQRRVPVRGEARLDARVRHPVLPRRRRHQPAADRADRLPHADRAAVVVGVGAARASRRSRSSSSRSRAAMLGVFVSIDLFLFYIFWDAMLIPMYFLIGIWGYERRIYAAVKFILYTMAGSVLMLIAIIALAVAHNSRHRQPELQPARSLRPDADASASSGGRSWPSRSRSPSRCRCSRSTPGCPTRTSRRRPPARSSWPACC